MSSPASDSSSKSPATGTGGVAIDFTGVFKVEELRAPPPPPQPAAPKKIPSDILIGAQELSNGNCFINLLQPRPKRIIDVAKTTVLIVEDDTTTQYLLHMLLSRAGYQTRRAGGAEEFILAMQKPPLPDLVILDVRLKGNVSGFKILAKIRAHPKIRSLPVIILTGSTEPEDLVQGVTLGADAYLSKPTKAKALMDAVTGVLGGQI